MAAVVRQVKLPDGTLQKIKVPEEWGKEEIRSALQKKGIIEGKPAAEPKPERKPVGAKKHMTTRPTQVEEGGAVAGLIKGLEFIDRPRAAVVGAMETVISGEGGDPVDAMQRGLAGEQHPLMGDVIFEELMKARQDPTQHPWMTKFQNFLGKGIRFKMPTKNDWGIAEIYDDDPHRVDAAIAAVGGVMTDIALDPVTYTGAGLTKKGAMAKINTSLKKEGKEITDPKLRAKMEDLAARGEMTELRATVAGRLREGQTKVRVAGVPIPGVVSGPIAEATGKFRDFVKNKPIGESVSRAFSTKAGLDKNIGGFAELEERLLNIIMAGKNEAVRQGSKFTKDVKSLADEISAQTGNVVKPDDLNRIIVEEVERAKLSSFVNNAPVEDVVTGPRTLRDKFNTVAGKWSAKVKNMIRPENMTDETKALIVTHPTVRKYVTDLKNKNAQQIVDEVNAGVSIAPLGETSVEHLNQMDTVLREARAAGVNKVKNPLTGKPISTNGLAKQLSALKKEINDAERLDYFVHAMTPEAKAEHIKRLKKTAAISGGKKYSTKHASTLERKYKNMSIEEINAAAREGKLPGFEGTKIEKFFYDDPAIAQTIRDIRHRKAMAVAEFFAETKNRFGRSTKDLRAEAIAAGAKKSISVQDALPAGWSTVKNKKAALLLRGQAFPDEIAARLDAHYENLLDVGKTDAFLEMYDGVQNWWKAWTLGIFPAYHVRNAVGNVWNNFVTGTTDPSVYATAVKLQNGVDGVLKTVDGRSIPFDEIRSHMEELGVRNRGFIGTDIEQSIKAEIGQAKWVTLSRDSKAIHYGKKVGQAFENNARIAKFMDELQKGAGFRDAAQATKKALFDYSDLTRFEKNVAKRLAPFYCVPDTTEILTQDGWKVRQDLRVGEHVLTYNLEKDCTEWHPVEDIASFDFDDELMVMQNKRVKFSFTPDHRFPVQVCKTIVKGKQYGGNRKIVRAYELNTSHTIPFARQAEFPSSSILSDTDAALLGWLITDGYVRRRKGGFEAMIYQSPKKYADEIRKKFADYITSESIHPDTGVICFRLAAKKLTAIRSFFQSKSDIPSIVTRLSKSAAEAMYTAMLEAEGHYGGDAGTSFTQKPGPVLDGFQILCHLLGKSFHISSHKSNGCCYGYVKKTNNLGIEACQFTTEKYQGIVWCPKTKNSTWVMRQDGDVIVTGNTWSSKNIPLQVEYMIKSPGKYKAIDTLRREIEAGTEDPNEYVLADWMLDNYPIRVKIDELDGKPRYFMLGGWLPAADVWKLAADPIQLPIDLLSPIIKIPGEYLTNKNWFTWNDIKHYDSEEVSYMGDLFRISPHTKKLLNNIRVLSTLDAMLPESYKGLTPQTVRDLSPEEKKLQFLTGIKLYGIDLETERMFRAKETEKRVGELGVYLGKSYLPQRKASEREREGLSREIQTEINKAIKMFGGKVENE